MILIFIKMSYYRLNPILHIMYNTIGSIPYSILKYHRLKSHNPYYIPYDSILHNTIIIPYYYNTRACSSYFILQYLRLIPIIPYLEEPRILIYRKTIKFSLVVCLADKSWKLTGREHLWILSIPIKNFCSYWLLEIHF